MVVASQSEIAAPIEREPLIDSLSARWALIIGATIAEAMLLVLPSFVGALSDDLKLPIRRIGMLGAADMLGIALAGATGFFWVRRISWRRGALGALLMLLLCNAACFGLRRFPVLIGARVLAGGAAGVLCTISLTGLMTTRNAARNGGMLLITETAASALGVLVLDSVAIAWRLDAVYAYVLLLLIPFLPLAWRYLPEDPRGAVQVPPPRWGAIAIRGAPVLIGAGSYFLMIGGVWGYLEGIARAAGLTLTEAGHALSLGLILSLFGAATAAVMGLQFGRAIPLIVSGAVQISALCLLTRLDHFPSPILAFYLVNAGFQIIWSYVVPYFMVLFKEIEPGARFVPLYSTTMHLMLAAGPYAGAFFIHDQHYGALLGFGIVLAALCYAAFLSAVWLGRQVDVRGDSRLGLRLH
jgi:predicted MFS family arabinose efflux permease